MLEIKGLTVQFGGIKALDRLSIDIPPKSIVGLMGPNGAGKTTVINSISRICHPTEGRIVFDGIDLLKKKPDEISALGVARTFQDLNFFNQISKMLVIDYVRLGQFDPKRIAVVSDSLYLKKSRFYERKLKARARAVLEFFHDVRDRLEPSEEERGYPFLMGREGFADLLDVEHKPIGMLSFAWRRRLDLARALVTRPRLLILDEPTQGLPPDEIENLLKVLKLIQSDLGITALVVEHNIETLSAISDKIVVMDMGRKIFEGTPLEVTSNPTVVDAYLGAKVFAKTSSRVPRSSWIGLEAREDVAVAEPILEVSEVDLFYGHAQALFSVSMKIYAKQVVSILGTNGSGKSTLLKAISGLVKPSVGEIRVKGQAIPLGWPEVAVDCGIHYVPQGHIIFPELTVSQNLRVAAYSFEKKGFKFKDSLDKVLHYFPSLREYLKHQAGALSGGQQQMLAICQAIMGKPEVLLLDEPSLGLSPKLVDTLFAIISEIVKAEDCTVVIVEQNVRVALDISDMAFIMNSGGIVAGGTAQQLEENEQVIKKYMGFK